jgi:hypothetical protein
MLLLVFCLEGVVALALVLAVSLALLLLEQVVALWRWFFECAHGEVMPRGRGYNPRRNRGAWRNW